MKLKDTTTIFNALADKTRLRILNLLGEGELCVCDLMKVLREPQSKISRHLIYLRGAGLVEGRKDKLWMYYSLSMPSIRTFRVILGALDHGRSDFDEFKKDIKSLRKNKNHLVACC